MNTRYVDYREIGERIKALREEKGWTQTQLQHISGVSRRRITSIENRNAISMDHFIWLTIALRASADYLIFGENSQIPTISGDKADYLMDALDDIRGIIESQRIRC